jgi:hypothetical protein
VRVCDVLRSVHGRNVGIHFKPATSLQLLSSTPPCFGSDLGNWAGYTRLGKE